MRRSWLACAALVAATCARAQTNVVAPWDAEPANLPEVCAALAALDIVNVACPPFNASTNTSVDNCAAWQRIDAATPATGIRVQFGRGEYRSSCPFKLRQQSIYEGAGGGATILSTMASGTGNALMQIATPRTCTGGTGDATTCDDALNGGTRGPGCVCNKNADCQSGTCAGGTTARNITVRGFRFLLRIANSVGVDLSMISQSRIEDNFFSVVTSTGNTQILLASSDGGGIGGFDNVLFGNFVQGGAIGVWIMDRANGTRVIANQISSNLIGLQIDTPTNSTQITNNNFQSNTTEDVLDNGQLTAYTVNRWENANPHLVIGASAVGAALSSKDVHIGVGAPITNSGTSSRMDGLPFGATAPITCASTTPGASYYDTSPLPSSPIQLCFCNAQGTPRYCRQDTGACGSSTTDCL